MGWFHIEAFIKACPNTFGGLDGGLLSSRGNKVSSKGEIEKEKKKKNMKRGGRREE